MNSRIIYVPQLPQKLRYSEWWISVFKEKFKENFDEVIVLGEVFLRNNTSFSLFFIDAGLEWYC